MPEWIARSAVKWITVLRRSARLGKLAWPKKVWRKLRLQLGIPWGVYGNESHPEILLLAGNFEKELIAEIIGATDFEHEMFRITSTDDLDAMMKKVPH